jgi:hypothetical protein
MNDTATDTPDLSGYTSAELVDITTDRAASLTWRKAARDELARLSSENEPEGAGGY